MSVVLIGFKGAGKSTVGPSLAALLGYAFADLDERIERAAAERLGGPVTSREAYRRLGEREFRVLERRLLEETLAEEKLLCSLGGGAALAPGAGEILRPHCVVYLRVPEADLLRRVRAQGWPAFLDDEPDPEAGLRRRLSERLPRYEELATITVDNPDGATPSGVAEEAARKVNAWLRSNR